MNLKPILSSLKEAQAQGVNAKPVIIGPVTYLYLSKEKDDSNRLDLIDKILPVYSKLLDQLADAGAEWVQIDEPILVKELSPEWKQALEQAYHTLKDRKSVV